MNLETHFLTSSSRFTASMRVMVRKLLKVNWILSMFETLQCTDPPAQTGSRLGSTPYRQQGVHLGKDQ